MTSSDLSKKVSQAGQQPPSDTTCRSCGAPLASRPEFGYPVLAQTAFGISFVAFLLLSDRVLRIDSRLLWVWSAVQIGLGLWLAHGRARSRRRVWRCVRCGVGLP